MNNYYPCYGALKKIHFVVSKQERNTKWSFSLWQINKAVLSGWVILKLTPLVKIYLKLWGNSWKIAFQFFCATLWLMGLQGDIALLTGHYKQTLLLSVPFTGAELFFVSFLHLLQIASHCSGNQWSYSPTVPLQTLDRRILDTTNPRHD